MRCTGADAFVVAHLAAARTPPELIDLMREELRTLRHVPDEGLRVQRQRIETAIKRLGDRYIWQEIDEAEYRAERRQLEAAPRRAAAARRLQPRGLRPRRRDALPFAAILADTTPRAPAAASSWHIVERVPRDRGRRQRDPGATRGAAVLRGLRRREAATDDEEVLQRAAVG